MRNTNIPLNTLLIIGNGFDLNCQIHSSFEDFFNTVNVNHNIWYLLSKFAFPKDSFVGPVIIRTYKKSEVLWMDVETLIKNVLFGHTLEKEESNRLLKEFGCTDYLSTISNIYKNRNNSNYLYFSDQVRMLKSFFSTRSIECSLSSFKKLVDFLYEELLRFECDFQKYIETISSNSQYKRNSERLFSLLNDNNVGDCDVLSFNYTSPKLSSNTFGSSNTINYIHGSVADKNIIIGYDSSEFKNPAGNKLYLSKSYQKLFSNLQSFSLPEKEDIGYIKIYGHSLGLQDYSYFHSIFDYYDITNNNNISLIFYYTPYKETQLDNEIIKQQYIASVYDLLNKYSFSVDFANEKINTLISKLLLENRLKIESISKLSTEEDIK